jgi:hypothetical protein
MWSSAGLISAAPVGLHGPADCFPPQCRHQRRQRELSAVTAWEGERNRCRWCPQTSTSARLACLRTVRLELRVNCWSACSDRSVASACNTGIPSPTISPPYRSPSPPSSWLLVLSFITGRHPGVRRGGGLEAEATGRLRQGKVRGWRWIRWRLWPQGRRRFL